MGHYEFHEDSDYCRAGALKHSAGVSALHCAHLEYNCSTYFHGAAHTVRKVQYSIVSLSINWFAGGVKGDISRCPQLERAHTNSNRIILLRNWGPEFLTLPLELEQMFHEQLPSGTNYGKLL